MSSPQWAGRGQELPAECLDGSGRPSRRAVRCWEALPEG